MKIRVALLSVILTVGSFASSSVSGGIILSFAPSSPSPLIAGSSGTLDVRIHSNASDVLDAFQVDFTLTSVGFSPVGGVKFSATQQDSQLTDPNYVFAGISLSQNTAASVGAANFARDGFSGYDATDDGSASPFPGNPVPVTLNSTDRLLFRLNLDAVNAGSYQITIASATFVIDQLLDPTDPLNQISFSGDPGMISVADSTAVPEPSSAVLLGLACAFGLLLRRSLTPQSIRHGTDVPVKEC